MNLEDLANIILNCRVGRPERGYSVVPSLDEQIAVPSTPTERQHYSHFSSAFLDGYWAKHTGVGESITAAIFGIAKEVINE